MSAAAIVSLRIAASPARAFEAFTGEIERWWSPDPLFALTRQGDGVLRFEPGPKGRLVSALPGGGEFEIGRVLVWEPGARLVLDWRQEGFAPHMRTTLEVRFEAMGEETRVTIEHRGWNTVPRENATRHGMELVFFQRKLVNHWRALLAGLGETLQGQDPSRS